MSANLSPEQLERISAYLDGMLPTDEARQVQEAAKRDATLQSELAELSLTRKLLRELPSVQIPRSFTLRPEQVHPQTQLWSPRWFNSLCWASIAMSTLLAMVVSANLYFGGLPSATPVMQTSVAEGGAMASADTANTVTIEIPETAQPETMLGAAPAPDLSNAETPLVGSGDTPLVGNAAPAETETAKVAASVPEATLEATPEAEILTAEAPPLQPQTINPLTVALRVAGVVLSVMLLISILLMLIVRSRTAR